MQKGNKKHNSYHSFLTHFIKYWIRSSKKQIFLNHESMLHVELMTETEKKKNQLLLKKKRSKIGGY